MILDKQLTLSDGQALGNIGTVVSQNTIDLLATGVIPSIGGSPISDFGRGGKPHLLVQMTETAASGGASTTDFQLIMSDNADLSAPTVLQTTTAQGKATLVAGYQARLGLPAGITKRYLGIQWVNATANYTAGKVHASLVLDRQTNPSV
jgi:hypothetical protein